MDLREWEKVLVVQTSFLGDTVLTLPLLAEIKRRFPATKLSVLCGPQAKEILEGHPAVDEIILDDKKAVDKGWVGLWRKAQLVKKKQFTMALSPHRSLRSALLLFLARVPRRVGFRQSKGRFFFHTLVAGKTLSHDIERNLAILGAFGIEVKNCHRALDLPVTPQGDERIKRLLNSLGIDTQKVIIGINPGSVWPTKRWSVEGFARLIALLKRDYDCEILLFGAADDAAIAAKIQGLCGNLGVNLAGQTPLPDLPAALSLCKILITNDSAPMHIAVALGVPVVAIFCATTPSLGFYPFTRRAIVVEKTLPCRPCTTHGGRRCPLGTEDCMRLIPPEEVLRAVKRLLLEAALTPIADGNSNEPQFVAV